MSKLYDLPRDFLKEGHCIQKSASGTSMLPSITDGTVLQIEPLQHGSVRLGDVVYFHDNNGNTKIHRVSLIIKKGNNTFIQTWGDNCENPDVVIIVLNFLVGLSHTGVKMNGTRWTLVPSCMPSTL